MSGVVFTPINEITTRGGRRIHLVGFKCVNGAVETTVKWEYDPENSQTTRSTWDHLHTVLISGQTAEVFVRDDVVVRTLPDSVSITHGDSCVALTTPVARSRFICACEEIAKVYRC